MIFEEAFLKDIIKRFKNYKDLGDKTFAQLQQDADFLFQPSPESNSIAVIVQHMHGNMLSRWTNFLTEDGEKEWRRRDDEFEIIPLRREQVISLWNEGWNCVMHTLSLLTTADLMQTITIRTEPLLAYDAILRQLAHYPYHVGQIVYIGKLLKNEEWLSLSIPKGNSHAYLESIKKAQEK